MKVKSIRNASSYRDSLLTGKKVCKGHFSIFEHTKDHDFPLRKIMVSCVLGNTWALRRRVVKAPPRDFNTIQLSRRKYVGGESNAEKRLPCLNSSH